MSFDREGNNGDVKFQKGEVGLKKKKQDETINLGHLVIHLIYLSFNFLYIVLLIIVVFFSKFYSLPGLLSGRLK